MPLLKSLNCYIAKLLNRKKRFSDSAIQRFSFGFTLIELLVVISIIAILVAAATASWTNAQQKSRDGKRKSDLKGVQQALEQYFQNNGHYPDTGAQNTIKCDGANIAWGNVFTCGQITYMNPLAKDPINSLDFVYNYQAIADPPSIIPLKYVLSAKLENDKDPDRCDLPQPNGCVSGGKLPCQPAPTKNYCVTNP